MPDTIADKLRKPLPCVLPFLEECGFRFSIEYEGGPVVIEYNPAVTLHEIGTRIGQYTRALAFEVEFRRSIATDVPQKPLLRVVSE